MANIEVIFLQGRKERERVCFVNIQQKDNIYFKTVRDLFQMDAASVRRDNVL